MKNARARESFQMEINALINIKCGASDIRHLSKPPRYCIYQDYRAVYLALQSFLLTENNSTTLYNTQRRDMYLEKFFLKTKRNYI